MDLQGDEGHIRVAAQMRIDGFTTDSVRRTYSLLKHLFNKHGVLRVTGIDDGHVAEFPFRPSDEAWDDETLEHRLEALGVIEREFGVQFVFPDPMPSDYEQTLSLLSSAIADGKATKRSDGPVGIMMRAAVARALLSHLAEERDLPVEAVMTFNLFGQTFTDIVVKMTLVGARLADDRDVLEGELRQVGQEDEFEVRLLVREIVHTFPRWEKKEEPSSSTSAS